MLGVYVNHVPQKGSTRFGEVAGAQGVRRQGFVGGGRCGIIDWLGVSLWRVCGGCFWAGFGVCLEEGLFYKNRGVGFVGDCCYLCMNYILSVVCLGVRGILNRVHVDLVGSVRVSVRVNV